MAARMINCVKLGKTAPALDKPPFDGELGREIFEKVSAEAWKTWSEDMMIKIINEYRLNLADPDHYNVLLEQMRAFLNLGADPEKVLEVENAARGRGEKA